MKFKFRLFKNKNNNRHKDAEWFKKAQGKMKKANLDFWNLPEKQQRIAVAKDVLKQLSTGFYNGVRQRYVRMVFFHVTDQEQAVFVGDRDKFKTDKDFADVIDFAKQKNVNCDVCGIGACFMSLASIGDAVNINDVFSRSSGRLLRVVTAEPSGEAMRLILDRVFSQRQQSLIECAFEIRSSHKEQWADYQSKLDAVTFGYTQMDSNDRLAAIMQNIIRNNGEFIPKDIQDLEPLPALITDTK